MSVLFKGRRSSRPNAEGQKLYYVQLVNNGNIGIDEIAAKIKLKSSLTQGDVLSVIRNLLQIMQDAFKDGKSVKLDGLGSFFLVARSKGNGVAQKKKSAPTTCNTPCLLLSYLQAHQDPNVCECATRIYHQQMSQLLTYGEDAKPSPTEVLDIVETQILHLKITIIEERIKKLSQDLFNALEQNDINQYKALSQEKKQWTEMLRVAWKKMKG